MCLHVCTYFILLFHTPCCITLQHIIETVSVGTRQISRSRATYLEVYEFLRKHVYRDDVDCTDSVAS